MSRLFEPLTIRGVTVANRAWMSPMCQYSAAPDGVDIGAATGWHMVHLGARASGGAGLVMVEATAVSPEGRITPYDLGLWNDRQRDSLIPVAEFIRGQGATAAIQLAHAGRKGSTIRPWQNGRYVPGGSRTRSVSVEDGGWDTLAPSAVAFGPLAAPQQLTLDQLDRIVSDFVGAARRALDAGFQVAEIHGAHGYLINEFLSPYANRRTDEYGGSFENRLRFPLRVVDAVRAVWPQELPLFFRASASDWLSENADDEREGWTSSDTVDLARVLVGHGVDLMDLSSGGIAPDAKIISAPGYQVPFAAAVRAGSGVLAAAVGRITTAAQADEIITDGHADAVMLGRELLRDPFWVRRAAQELQTEPRWPVQYGYAVS